MSKALASKAEIFFDEFREPSQRNHLQLAKDKGSLKRSI